MVDKQPARMFYECLKQGNKKSDFCLKQGQGMRGRAAPHNSRIYRVPPPWVTYSVTHILEIPQMIYFQNNLTLFSLECRLSVGLYSGLHNGLPNIDIGSSFFMMRNVLIFVWLAQHRSVNWQSPWFSLLLIC